MLWLAKYGFTIDEDGFNKLMKAQKERGREASKDKFASVNVTLNDLSDFNLINSKSNYIYRL